MLHGEAAVLSGMYRALLTKSHSLEILICDHSSQTHPTHAYHGVGEEELPFSMEAREQPSRSGRKGRAMQRVDSEPPTPVCRQVLVRQPGQHDAPQPLFQGEPCIAHRTGNI